MPELNARGGGPALWFGTRGHRSNDPLVLLHGFTQTHRSWDALTERLAESHFVVLPDLPGHGASGVARSRAAMGLERTADAVAELIEATCEGRKTAVVGYSLGGRVALALACKRQELLSRLVLEGASPGIESARERKERRARDEALADEIEERGLDWFVGHWEDTPLFATQRGLPREAAEAIRGDRMSNTARGLAASLRAAGPGRMTPLWGKLGNIKIPVLLVAGKEDRKYSQAAEAMHARIPGSVVAEISGAGHCVHLEKPEEFAELVGRFLADLPVARAGSRSR